MEGYGCSWGAITVLNAFATGIGAAIGVNLKVDVYVESSLDTKIDTYVNGCRVNVETKLIDEILNIFKQKYGLTDKLNIKIFSEIPPERGLKSSSSVANALILALANYLGLNLDNDTILNINVAASLKSGVSITGALDDAAASLIGGLVITDNVNRKILHIQNIDRYNVLISYPEQRVKTSSLKEIDFNSIKNVVNSIVHILLEGRWKEAMILNGIIYSEFLGYSPKPIFKALEHGAEAAVLSGKGPAYAALAKDVIPIMDVWRQCLNDHNFIITRTR